MTTCAHCGTALLTPRRLKTFCSYACRGQYRVHEAISHHSGLVRSKNTIQNKALQHLKRQSVGHFTFARINSCTIQIDAAKKRGIGWLMEVAWASAVRQRWVACVAEIRSEPLWLDAAKEAATVLLRQSEKSDPRDWIAELNQIAANEVDRNALQQERRRWPIDLMGGSHRGKVDSKLRQVILDTERVLVDEGDAA